MQKPEDIHLARDVIPRNKEKNIKMIIDRFEGNFAVVELPDKTMINVPRHLIPKGAKEGSVLANEFKLDEVETQKRTDNISKLMLNLFED